MLPCLYKKHLGIECPGCGMQRSFVALINGDFEESFHQYPPLILVLVLLIFLALHLKFKFSAGPKVLKAMFVVTATAIVVNYVVHLSVNGLH